MTNSLILIGSFTLLEELSIKISSAPTYKGIGIADHALHQLREVHQDFVADEMSVSIVDILEVVDVKNHERDRAPAPVQLFLFAEEHAAESGTVETTRKRVFLAGLLVFALFYFESA